MKLNYLVKVTLLVVVTLHSSCDAKSKEKKIIFIPEEYRIIDFENLNYKEKKEIIESAPKEMKTADHGEVTSLIWTAPISEYEERKNFKLGNYNIEIAGIQKLNYKFERNILLLSDDDCFSPLEIKRIKFSFNKACKR